MASLQPQPNRPLALKRKRLSYACNHCRLKKTRCDERQPTCRACEGAGVECITTDKRKPNAEVVSRLKRISSRKEETLQVQPDTAAKGSVEQGADSTMSDNSPTYVPVSRCDPRPAFHTHEHLPMIPSPQAETNMARQLTQWLEIAFARLNRPMQLLATITEDHAGLPQVPIIFFPIHLGPDLPTGGEIRRHMESFFDHIHPVYPFISRGSVETMLNKVCSFAQDADTFASPDVPSLAFTYLICAFGIISGPYSSQSQENAEGYLLHANMLVGPLLGIRSVASIQAILLFCIVLRARDSLSWCWDLLTIGISVAQSLRLHEMTVAPPNSGGDRSAVDQLNEEGQRTWWCLYAFEKILAFDLCRLSRILDSTLSTFKTWSVPRRDQNERLCSAQDCGNGKLADYKEALVSLANLLSEIQDRSLHSWGQKELADLSIDDAVATIIQSVGEIETMVQSWQDRLPTEYKVASTAKYRSSSSPRRVFFSFHYYQIKLILYRNSLLRDRTSLQREIDQFGAGFSWQSQIQNGPEACAEAATDMIRLLGAVSHSERMTYVSLPGSPLLAAYVLVVYICNEPRSLFARTYLELTKAALALSRQQYRRYTGSDRLEHITGILENFVLQCLADDTLPDSEGAPLLDDIPVEDMGGDAIPTLSRLGFPTFLESLTTDWVSWDPTDWQTTQ